MALSSTRSMRGGKYSAPSVGAGEDGVMLAGGVMFDEKGTTGGGEGKG